MEWKDESFCLFYLIYLSTKLQRYKGVFGKFYKSKRSLLTTNKSGKQRNIGLWIMNISWRTNDSIEVI